MTMIANVIAASTTQNSTDRSVEVGFISGFLSSGSVPPLSDLPQRDDLSWLRQFWSVTGRTSRPPLPSGRCSCRLMDLRWVRSGARRRRLVGWYVLFRAGCTGTRARGGAAASATRPVEPVLPQEHLLGERDLGAEQRADGLATVDALDRLADERSDREHLELLDLARRRQGD